MGGKKGHLIGMVLVWLCSLMMSRALLAQADVSFLAPHEYSVPSIALGATVGDFNGDAVLDLAVASEGARKVSILLERSSSDT